MPRRAPFGPHESTRLVYCVCSSLWLAGAPGSPAALSTVPPCAAALTNALRSASTLCSLGNVCSVAPKLCEITSASPWSTT